MKYYGYVNTLIEGIPFQRLPEYEIGYDRYDELPEGSNKVNWNKTRDVFYIGYSKIELQFPTDSSIRLRNDFIGLMRDDFIGQSMSEEYLLYSHFLNCAEEKNWNIPSADYRVRSNNPCGRRYELNKDQISNLIVEWIDHLRYHFLTIKQFGSIDFNNYFDNVDRECDHFKCNMKYLANIIWKPKKTFVEKEPYYESYYEIEKWHLLSSLKKRHIYEKVENILRNNITGFAIDHFAKYAKNPNVRVFT